MIAIQRTAAEIRRWAGQDSGNTVRDDALLRRFAKSRDEAAFAELVRRHGSLVLGVGRRVLGDHQAAEDILQATFLLLARKSKIIAWQRTVAPWLYSVAFRLARTARRRRRYQEPLQEPQPLPASETDPAKPLLWQEVRAALDEELARLSEPIRAPLVLCYLQGRTRDEAANALGWTLATLKRRLERGRNLLRARLTRRGLALSAIGGAMLLDGPALSAEFAQNIIQQINTGILPASVAALLEGQRFAPWKKLAFAIAMLFTAGLGAGWFSSHTPVTAEPPTADKPENKATIATDTLGDPLPDGAVARLGTTRLRPGQSIQGIAISPDGKQLATWAKAWGTGGSDRLIFSDTATGRQIKSISLPPCILHTIRWLADGRGLALAKIGQSDDFLWEFTDANASLPIKENARLNSMTSGDVYGAAISPDGRWLATGGLSLDGGDQPIRLWEVQPNSQLASLKSRELGRQSGHGMFVLFSADSKRVFALSRGQEPSKPGAPLAAPPPGLVAPAAGPLVPGKLADRAKLVVYDVETGKRLNEFDVPPSMEYMKSTMPAPKRMALSPNGKTLWIGDEKGVVHALDWAAGKELHSFAVPPGKSRPFRTDGISVLLPNPDGQTIYIGDASNSLTIRDAKTGQVRATVRDDLTSFGHLILSPDGTRLAAADVNVAGQVRVIDAKNGKDLLALPGHGNMLTGLNILPDGTAMTAGLDRTVRWWDLETGRELKQQSIDMLRYWLVSSAFTSDGRGLFGLHDDHVIHVDLPTGKRTQVTKEPIKPVSLIHGVSGSTAFVNTADRKVQQWDAKTGAVRQTFDPPPEQNGHPNHIVRTMMSPDEKQVAIISTGTFSAGPSTWYTSGQISLYDAKTGELRRFWQTGEASWECAEYSPDGKFLIVSGYPIPNRLPGAPSDSNMPISAMSGLMLLDAVTGDPIRTYEPAVKSSYGYHRVVTVAISPNNHLLTAAQNDGSIAVYELATGNLCRLFGGHRNEVSQMAFTADGRRLVSVSRDFTGLVWDVTFASLAKPSEAERAQLWIDAAKPEWLLAGPALAALAEKPGDLLALVREHLKPADKPDVDRESIAKSVEQLDDQLFAVRERASAALGRLGREALPLLQEHLSDAKTGERRARLQKIVDRIRLMPIPSDHLRQMRMLAVLEQTKSAAAREELKRLAGGHADASLTREAKAALDRARKK